MVVNLIRYNEVVFYIILHTFGSSIFIYAIVIDVSSICSIINAIYKTMTSAIIQHTSACTIIPCIRNIIRRVTPTRHSELPCVAVWRMKILSVCTICPRKLTLHSGK